MHHIVIFFLYIFIAWYVTNKQTVFCSVNEFLKIFPNDLHEWLYDSFTVMDSVQFI